MERGEQGGVCVVHLDSICHGRSRRCDGGHTRTGPRRPQEVMDHACNTHITSWDGHARRRDDSRPRVRVDDVPYRIRQEARVQVEVMPMGKEHLCAHDV